MNIFLSILQSVIFPVFILISVGVLLQRKFKLDMNTLSKITFYYLIPAVIFVKFYQTEIPLNLVTHILYFLILQALSLLIISGILARIFRFEKGLIGSYYNSVILNNQGNYGLPVNALVFKSDPFAMSIQIIVMTFQNLLTFTFGIMNVRKVHNDRKIMDSFIQLFKTPVILGLLLAIILKIFHIKIPEMIWIPLEQASQGFLAIALLTLGAQVATFQINTYLIPITVSAITRLVISPLTAYLIISILSIEGVTAQTLFIASSFPTSRNSAAIALEYNHYPEFAAQIVLITTLLSSITVTATVYLASILF